MNYRYIIPSFFAILIMISVIVENYLHKSKDEEIESINKKSMEVNKTVYQTIFNAHKLTAQNHFITLMENHQAMELLKQYKYQTQKIKRDLLRGEIFRLLNKKYRVLKELGIRQFHLHTHKGDSLLRFHKPQKSGDSLIGIRNSIEYVNSTQKPFYGFEGGKIFPGFRYVFPIVYEGDHLGSVEFSIPFEVIEQEMQEVLPRYGYQLHLDSSISYEKVFDSFKIYFTPSPILEGHFIENSRISVVEKKLQNNELIQQIQTKIKLLEPPRTYINEDDFSIYFSELKKGYKANFVSIKDNENNHAAYLVCYGDFHRLIAIEEKYFYFHILFYVTIVTLISLIFLIVRQIKNLQEKNKNIQQIIDIQDNIVILTDGENINFANTKFFSFFGFESLEEFKKNHKCICEFFSQNERFFHLGKIKENQNWMEVIQTLPEAKRVVSMLGKNFELHAFSISINKFDEHFMLVSFNDISQTMIENIKLQEKTIHDTLTNAFNREYFEQSYKILLEKYEDGKYHFAVALLDIDHFKNVNDTYGHDAGDEVLVWFVKTIQNHLRGEDILIRWGGEEFVLILKIKTKEDLNRVLEQLRKVIELENFPTVKKLTCSIGGAIYKKGEDILQTIKRADKGVYKAKENGRNQVVVL